MKLNILHMKRIIIIIIAFGIFSCSSNKEINNGDMAGSFSGVFEHGNFSDKISFEIEQDSAGFKVFFTSLEQNANRIPFQGVELREDSINFKLQSDFYTYSFKNKWLEKNSKLQGTLTVDTITVPYTLEKELPSNDQYPKNEDVSFESNELKINSVKPLMSGIHINIGDPFISYRKKLK